MDERCRQYDEKNLTLSTGKLTSCYAHLFQSRIVCFSVGEVAQAIMSMTIKDPISDLFKSGLNDSPTRKRGITDERF